MICALRTLMRKYRDKKIYIWNINWDSIEVFAMAAFRRIDIQGFVTLQKVYTSEMYMNRPVLALERIEQEEDSIILVSDKVPEDVFHMLPDGKAIYWSDSLELNDELLQKKVIIYGIGYGAEKIDKMISQKGIEAELYCVTKKDNVTQHKGKNVIEAADLDKYADCAVIIGAKQRRSRWEILEVLSRFHGRVYTAIENRPGEGGQGLLDLHNTMLIQRIDLAVKQHRKIYLYSKKNAIAELIEDVLNIYDIKISGYVYDTEDKKQAIECIYEAVYDEMEDQLIIINEEFPERLIRARENIELAGFSLEKENYTALQGYIFGDDRLLRGLHEYHDPLVGGSAIYSHGKPGWKIYGREEKDRIRILVLGGSTSSEIYHPENWISKLYYNLCRKNIRTTIYNGAHPGNDIVSEMLRLLRDGPVLKPHIVISMSGVNNILYKETPNQFNERRMIHWVETMSPVKQYCSGVYSDEALYSFWSRNIKLLKLIAEFYEARFFGFLQPINILMEHMTLYEKSVFEGEESNPGYKDFSPFVSDEEDAYTNLMPLFEHQDGMYLDSCHYTDKAHRIIADKVCEAIMSVIQALQ